MKDFLIGFCFVFYWCIIFYYLFFPFVSCDINYPENDTSDIYELY
jgi:hypothetical protein